MSTEKIMRFLNYWDTEKAAIHTSPQTEAGIMSLNRFIMNHALIILSVTKYKPRMTGWRKNIFHR